MCATSYSGRRYKKIFSGVNSGVRRAFCARKTGTPSDEPLDPQGVIFITNSARSKSACLLAHSQHIIAPVIIAHHIILTGYGHWLPNDPRGSLSPLFRNPELRELGDIHLGRRKDQPSVEQIRAFYKAAEAFLHHPVAWFDRAKRQAVAEAFGEAIRSEKLTCYGCAVLRNHAHLLVRRHRLKHGEIIELLMQTSRERLHERKLLPGGHPLWSEDRYVKFKDTPGLVRGTIAYIQGNFQKHRLAAQEWDFVLPYDNWPFHKTCASR